MDTPKPTQDTSHDPLQSWRDRLDFLAARLSCAEIAAIACAKGKRILQQRQDREATDAALAIGKAGAALLRAHDLINGQAPAKRRTRR